VNAEFKIKVANCKDNLLKLYYAKFLQEYSNKLVKSLALLESIKHTELSFSLEYAYSVCMEEIKH